MTPKQILDSFSETLMQDERILSAQERALLVAVLQHARTASGSRETQDAVRAVVASAVGETVAQRAFGVLGGSIVERILEGTPSWTESRTKETLANPDPQPPQKGPGPPGVKAPPMPHRRPLGDPGDPQPPRSPVSPFDPQPPHTPAPMDPQPPRSPIQNPPSPSPDPQPPHGSPQVVRKSSVAVVERPTMLQARSVVLDEFLSPQEVEQLTSFALEHESEFSTSQIISPTEQDGMVNFEHRRSRVLMQLGKYEDMMLARIRAALPDVLRRLGMDEFAVTGSECQITASNDGDFFHFHSDNGSEKVRSRRLTFVYFFHREPKRFEGGELRIHDSRLENGGYVSEGRYQTIEPRQNQIVFFPCELMHEITRVDCPSLQFADSRFTVNGWLHH